MNKKLEAKDLINVGIFTALYFIVVMGVAMLGYIPIFILLLGAICPLIGGIPLMLFMTKVKKFGMITILGLLSGCLMMVFGMGYWPVITGTLFGFITDFLLQSGNYSSSKKTVIGYGVFSMWLIGNYIPMFITRESYFTSLQENFGLEYANTLMSYTPQWSFVVILASCFVSGILGGLFGKKVMKKHFQRAGIV